jgi:hypothetical protein
MPKDECLRNDEARMTNGRVVDPRDFRLRFVIWKFVILSTFVIRHSSFRPNVVVLK